MEKTRKQSTAKSKKAMKGLSIPRYYTQAGVDPFASTVWTTRTSRITNPDGSVVFEMKDAEIPAGWSQVAADIMVSKYFRKAGVPQFDADGSIILDENGDPVLGPERSAKQVIHRLAGCWRWWGETHGYFASEADAQAFYDELVLHARPPDGCAQLAAVVQHRSQLRLRHHRSCPGPLLRRSRHRRGPRESEDAYTHPQPHACFIQSVDDDLVGEGGIMDLWVREARLFKYGSGTGTNFSNLRGEGEPLSGGGTSSGLMSFLRVGDRAAGAIKCGGTTRRAAKMVCLDVDHPDIENFITWKAYGREEGRRRSSTLVTRPTSTARPTPPSPVRTPTTRSASPMTSSTRFATTADWNLTRRTDGSVHKTVQARDLWQQVAEAAWQSRRSRRAVRHHYQ